MTTYAKGNGFKFAVKTSDDRLCIGIEAANEMKRSLWPDVPWEDNIPILVKIPAQMISQTTTAWKLYPDVTPAFEPTMKYKCRDNYNRNKILLLPYRDANDLSLWQYFQVYDYCREDEYDETVKIPNPDYPIKVAEWNKQIADYLIALKAQYPTVRFVLLRTWDFINWDEINEPGHPQWKGFVQRTVAWPKKAAMSNMVKADF